MSLSDVPPREALARERVSRADSRGLRPMEPLRLEEDEAEGLYLNNDFDFEALASLGPLEILRRSRA